MSEVLYLNKEIVDIVGKSITRKIQIGDVGDISSRKSSFSYSIKIEKTTNSTRILDMLATHGNTSRKPFEFIVADYIVDGVPLIINGFAKVSSTSKYFVVNLFDGVKDLSERLKGKKIADLELADLDHFLTAQEYIDSYSNTEGFIYCIADYGQGVATNLKVEKQAPSIYQHTLFRKIFEQAGLILVGDFFTTNQDYLTEVVTPSKGYDIIDSAPVLTPKGGADTNELADFQQSLIPISITEKFTFTGIGLVGASIVSGNIKFSVAGTYKIDLVTSSDSEDTAMWLAFKINGVNKASISLDEGNGQTKNTSIIFTVAVNDVVSLYLNASSHWVEPPELFKIDYAVSSDTLLYLQSSGGQLIQASDYIGDLNQLDFVKDVINRFGLILHPIINSSDYRFEQIENILNDRATAEDWSDKVSLITDENYISGYAKSNKAVYQYPERIVIPNNDGEMIINNENAQPEKTMISSVFEIPNELGLLSGEKTYSIPIWSLDPAIVLEETPLKVMKIKRVNTTIQAKLFLDVSSVDQTGDIPYLSLEDMSMTYFLANYYLAFNNLIDNYKKMTLLLNLTVIDILNLDFFKLKYLRQTGKYYYLNNIVNRPNKLSKTTMIEIKEFNS